MAFYPHQACVNTLKKSTDWHFKLKDQIYFYVQAVGDFNKELYGNRLAVLESKWPLVELEVLSLSGCVAACNTHMI